MAGALVTIGSSALEVAINPDVGGTIVTVRHLPTGLSVLGETPWTTVQTSDGSFAAPDERHWLTRYTGGSPLLFPNGGDACTFEGTFHGFHGEASIAPWTVMGGNAASLHLSRRFFTVPVSMEREFSVDGEAFTVRESVRLEGARPIQVMWGQHATFGTDLLASDFVIETGARKLVIDDTYDPPANPLVPGTDGVWPYATGKAERYDMSRPRAPTAAMGYLRDFASPWAAIRRLDGAIATTLSWDASVFPLAWLWVELEGTPEARSHGQDDRHRAQHPPRHGRRHPPPGAPC